VEIGCVSPTRTQPRFGYAASPSAIISMSIQEDMFSVGIGTSKRLAGDEIIDIGVFTGVP
jgi:hypothetical protein